MLIFFWNEEQEDNESGSLDGGNGDTGPSFIPVPLIPQQRPTMTAMDAVTWAVGAGLL
jgi:hypothetical protein